MSRMKTFFIYFLILVGFYIISNLLINAYIKTSYFKIKEYEIDVKEATVTIIEAKASKDDGYIEGKISNPNDEDIALRYMVVELFSDSNVSLGKEYQKIERLKTGQIKDFKVTFTYNNVKSFKITFIDETEMQRIEEEKKNRKLIDLNLNTDERVETIINELEQAR